MTDILSIIVRKIEWPRRHSSAADFLPTSPRWTLKDKHLDGSQYLQPMLKYTSSTSKSVWTMISQYKVKVLVFLDCTSLATDSSVTKKLSCSHTYIMVMQNVCIIQKDTRAKTALPQAGGMPSLFKVVPTYHTYNCDRNAFELFPREEDGFTQGTKVHDLTEGSGAVHLKYQVAVRV